MENYTFETWILTFFLYCFLGWLWEVLYVSIKQRKWTNRGFLFGPFLPIYGFGAIVMLLSTSKVRDNLFLIYLFGTLGATSLEFIAGVAMETLFKVRYWDYSYRKFQYKGYICLHSTIGWGFFSVFLVKVLNVPVEKFIFSLSSKSISTIIILFVIAFTADLTKSIQNAFSLRHLLETMSMNHTAINSITSYVDSISIKLQENTEDFREYIDTILDGFKQYKNENLLKLSNKQTTISTNLYDRVSTIINKLSTDATKVNENSSERQRFDFILSELSSVKNKLVSSERSIKNIDLKDFRGALRLLKRNPTASSTKLNDEIEKIKHLDD